MLSKRALSITLIGFMAWGLSSPAFAAKPAIAQGSWAMVDMTKDVNNDGVIDGDGGVPQSGALSLVPSTQIVGAGNHIAQPNERLIGGTTSWYLSPAGFPVALNACASTGSSYQWSIKSLANQAVTTLPKKQLTAKTCHIRATLPEGSYTFTLTVTSGTTSQSVDLPAQVKNIVFLVMGDSYASGEGNPRNVNAWMNEGGLFATFRPYWDEAGCHRSVRSGPAMAALALEKTSPQTSVTLVDVSCSGATIRQGILGTQDRTSQSQVALAKTILGDQQVDVVSLSIGGNDIGFGSVLSACFSNANCPISKPGPGPLQSYPTLNAGVTDQTSKLPKAYADVAYCLAGRTCPNAPALSPTATVLPSLYPDIARNSNGSICKYLTMTAEDFTWARTSMLNPTPPLSVAYQTTNQGTITLPIASTLNQQISNTSALGWKPVTGTWTRSGDSAIGHGICAGSQAWVFGVQLGGQMLSAAFHPNPAGQAQLAQAIFEAAKSATA
jgi:GDSL-like Lipase/Acylhydrolase family